MLFSTAVGNIFKVVLSLKKKIIISTIRRTDVRFLDYLLGWLLMSLYCFLLARPRTSHYSLIGFCVVPLTTRTPLVRCV